MSSRPHSVAFACRQMLFCFLLLSLFLIAGETRAMAGKIRVAVIGSEATEPVRTLLTAEISKQADIDVVERAEIGKVATELALQTGGFNSAAENRVGQLLHADALVMLNVDMARKRLVMRVVAVAPGVVLFQDSLPLPIPGPEEWTVIAAKKLSPYFGNFKRSETARTPLSILRIRSVTAGWESDRLEKELGFLLSHRLANEPSLWVLERSQMGALEWEKALQANPSAFWTGSYLLDGSLTSNPAGFSVSARLRSAKQGKEIAVSAQGKDMRELANALAIQVTASLQVGKAGAPWDAAAEAAQFQDEALWAFRWKLYEEASEASEAAWAFGRRNDTLALLRVHAETNRLLATSAAHLTSSDFEKRPAPWMIECAATVVDRLQESLAWKGPEIPEEWVGLSAGSLWHCSLVLRECACHSSSLQPGELETLRAVRSQIRAVCEVLKPASAKYPVPNVRKTNLGFQPIDGLAPRESLYAVRGILGSLWQEDAEQCVSQMRVLFDEVDRLNENDRLVLKNTILPEQEGWAPWIVNWKLARTRESVATLRAALLKAPVPAERQIDVARMMLGRSSRVPPNYGAQFLSRQQTLDSLTEIENAIWNSREAFARKQIPGRYFFFVVNEIKSAEWKLKAPDTTEALHVKLFKYLLSANVANPDDLGAFAPDAEKLTSEDKQELLGLVRAAIARDVAKGNKFGAISGFLPNLEHLYTKGPMPIPSGVIPLAPARTAGESLRPAWTVSQAQILGGQSVNNPIIRYRQGRLYVLANNRGVNVTGEPNLLFVFNPQTGLISKSAYRGSPVAKFDLDAANGKLFITDGKKVSRSIAGEAGWTDFPIPEMDDPRLFFLDGVVYVTGSPGILVRLDAVTGKSEVLVSSRRRPALNALDDKPAYDISKVFKDGKGRLCVLLDFDRFYRQDETNKSWKEVMNTQGQEMPPAFERRLVLGAIGTDGFENRHFGRNPDYALRAMYGMLMIDKMKGKPPVPAAVPVGMPPGFSQPAFPRLAPGDFFGFDG
ncbi:MAG TPA: hypothetical protein VK961_08970, partial [Chthoniobacter sp.]|nr:hypothetical protein [Chthoniobacter sp.]